MSDILADLGLTLPREALAWWGWHDGSPGEIDPPAVGPPGDRFVSLTEAVKTYREFREMAESLVEPESPALADVEERWNRSWLPIRGAQLPVDTALFSGCGCADAGPAHLFSGR
jgi:hypothetical protein